MRNKVHVLHNGYSKMSDGEPNIMYSNCTCTLIITESNQNIIVDTMTPWNRSDILTALQKYCVSAEDISFVISTHGHSDHLGNNNLFLNATHIVGHDISHKDKFTLHNFQQKPYNITEDIEVRATPGHTSKCVSVIIKRTDLGIVAITGDLFEKVEDIDNSSIWMEAGSENIELQRINRSKIAHWADVIIPGHGPQFKVTDIIRAKLRKELSRSN